MNEYLTTIFLASFILMLFGIGYTLILLYTKKKIFLEQKAKLSEIEKSEKKYRDLFDHSIVGMFKFTLSPFQIIDVNESALRILNRNDLLSFQQKILSLPEKTQNEIISELRNDGIIHGMEVLFPDSGWVLVSAKIDSANIGYGAIIDITERKEYQSKTESQAQLLNESNDAIFVIDEHNKIVFWAKGAEKVYGWSEHEALHKEIGPLLFPADKLNDLQTALDETRHYNEWVGECGNLTKSGGEILVDCHWRRVRLLSSDEQFTMMINSDITEKRQMELHALRAQKLETVALLTSSIAHDLQNILAPVRISVGMLKSEPNNPKNALLLDAVEKSAQSGLELLQKILAFGKGIKGEKIPIEVNSLVKDTLENFQMINGDSIKIERHLHSQKQLILGDEQQLRQVLFNLFTNAKDALQDDGKITVSVQHPDDDLEIIQENPQFEPEKYIDISIKDNGIGITDEDMKRIFDPFFTTKKDNHGTGLGLAIVQNIIRNHGGVLTVESQYNFGTTFHIILPLLSRGE